MSVCVNCNSEFDQKNKYRETKTCSTKCRYEMSAKSTRAKSGAIMISACQGCGTDFENRVAKPKKFCTWDCMVKHRVEDSRQSRICEGCGNEFTHFKRQDQRTCSPACRNKVTARQRDKNYPKCVTCGIPTGSYNRIYCDEHRPRTGQKPAPRKVARCLGCGEEFSRPSGWQGKMHYCSNACSHKQVKSVRDKYVAILNEKAVVFHSGWEIRFWAVCLRFDIPIRSYDGPDIDTSAGTYRPDFIVNGDTVIDVKGWLRPESEVKYREAGIHLVSRDDLLEFERSGVLSVL